jgi:hypothetical protein
MDLLTASKRTDVLEHLPRPASIIRASSVRGEAARGMKSLGSSDRAMRVYSMSSCTLFPCGRDCCLCGASGASGYKSVNVDVDQHCNPGHSAVGEEARANDLVDQIRRLPSDFWSTIQLVLKRVKP